MHPSYKDVSFKTNFKHKKGYFSLWGMGGNSGINLPAFSGSNSSPYNIINNSSNTNAGASLVQYHSNKLTIRYVAGLSMNKTDNLQEASFQKSHIIDKQTYLSIGALGHYKIDSKLNVNFGTTVKNNYAVFENDNRLNPNDSLGLYYYKFDQSYFTLNSFVNINFRLNNYFSMRGGLHQFYFGFNNQSRIEPRISTSLNIWNATFGFAYGEYSKQNPIGLYLSKFTNFRDSVNVSYPNKNVGLIRSRQFVMSAEKQLFRDFLVKFEAFYHFHYKVPIAANVEYEWQVHSSALNLSYYSGDIDQRGIIYSNTGKGISKGLELMIGYKNNGYTLNFNSTIYNSTFSNKLGWHNTLFNNNFAVKLFAGKEFKLRAKNYIQINVAMNWAGGRRYTPIDCDLTYFYRATTLDNKQYLAKNYPDYFRFDFKTSYIINNKNTSHIISVDIRNLTNHNNIYLYGHYYNIDNIKTYEISQLKFLPIISYKLYFTSK